MPFKIIFTGLYVNSLIYKKLQVERAILSEITRAKLIWEAVM